MSRKILFSPVGGTDPISAVNAYDGSLLHICRYYKPDVVVLYMSAEVLEAQEKDNRYKYCLQQLMELQHREMEIAAVERPELTEVQDFDFFYDDFREEIQKIYSGMEESDELLINVSSGTPAMKSTLMVLGTFGEYPCRLIQVVTPAKKMNEHQHRDYDVETLWELNEDNLPDAQNRCVEINCPSLLKLKQEEIIKQHIGVYDYQAALMIAESMPKTYTGKYIDLLKIGDYRIQLQLSETDKLSRQAGINVFPVRDSNKRKYFEYALMLQIKLLRKEYADFIRALSPLIADLFELILKNSCGIDVNDYCFVRGGLRKWDKYILTGNDAAANGIYNSILSEYSDFKGTGPVFSSQLLVIIQHNSTNTALLDVVGNLRDVESKVRNLAAHEIVSVTPEMIHRLTGYTPERIMRFVKNAFAYAGINVKTEYWNSYDDMNKMIMDSM